MASFTIQTGLVIRAFNISCSLLRPFRFDRHRAVLKRGRDDHRGCDIAALLRNAYGSLVIAARAVPYVEWIAQGRWVLSLSQYGEGAGTRFAALFDERPEPRLEWLLGCPSSPRAEA
jgi:hypothetical protein